MSFQQFFLVLRARWKIILSIFLLVLISDLVATLLWPKQYVGNTAVVVDVKSPDPIAGQLMPVQLTPSYMATQVDIINSDRVALRVVKMLKLEQMQYFRDKWQDDTEGRGNFAAWISSELQKKLDVSPSRESNVVNISFMWPDAKTSAVLANAFAQAYIDTTLELTVEPAKQYASWFDERNKVLRDNLEKAQKRLSEYQRAKGIVATDERLDVENARLTELSTQLVAAQSQRFDSASRQHQAAGGSETLPEVLQNPLVAGLKSDLSKLEAQRQEIGSRLGHNHPEFKRIENEVNALRERVSAESNKVARSLSTSNAVNQQRESDLRGALAAQKAKVLQLKKQRDEISFFQNDVANAQRAYDLVTQRLTQASLESQSQQTNVVVLNSATEPAEPARPRKLLNAVLGVFLGGLLGIGSAILLEVLYPRVRGSHDLGELLGIPVLGMLPAVNVPKRKRSSKKKISRAGRQEVSSPVVRKEAAHVVL